MTIIIYGAAASSFVRTTRMAAHVVAEQVTGEDARMEALRLVMERIAPGRSETSRPPHAQEMKATMVLRIPLEEAVAKVRTGGPNDDEDDLDLPYWAGCVPIEMVHRPPLTSRSMIRVICSREVSWQYFFLVFFGRRLP